jgi:hypothetical protein
MLNWLRAYVRRRKLRPRIELLSDGFTTVAPNGDRFPVQWADVVRIAAYKRDLITTDEIILAFELVDRPGLVQEVSEEWDGCAELFGPMERHLGISSAWYREIMLPAFHTSFWVLFERAGAPALDSTEPPAG